MWNPFSWLQDRAEEARDFVLEEVVEPAVDFVFEDVVSPIVEPVMDTVSNVAESIFDDPVKAAAQAIAIGTGNAWALPIIAGVDTALEGGDIEDIAKSAAQSYIMQQAGDFAGEAFGGASGPTIGETGAAVDYSVNDPFGGSMPPSSSIAGNVASGAAKAGISAAISGKDPLQAIISGGIGSLISEGLNEIPEFAELPDFLKSSIASTIKSQILPNFYGQITTQQTPQQTSQQTALNQAQQSYNDALAQMLASQNDPFYADVKMADLEKMFSGETPLYYRSPA